ncbi:hypothetical protein [Alicyclobacillus sp. ALC3]|uniref:hypothetical protein n=1 Tax=Alicyclobacillus sp. ALC3 TaxID=2796143 RepID=UPI0023795C50|nr:hypothetical protein [Alicyclobacillus sp. ALC3]WDL99066.1 hypothetical protein JC200_10675 [Alicyclobacillus sp. ALC3]
MHRMQGVHSDPSEYLIRAAPLREAGTRSPGAGSGSRRRWRRSATRGYMWRRRGGEALPNSDKKAATDAAGGLVWVLQRHWHRQASAGICWHRQAPTLASAGTAIAGSTRA